MTDLPTAPAPGSTSPLGYADLPRLIGLMAGDEKHSTSADSTLDVLWVLYDRVLDVRLEALDDPDRDRFLLSKGHGPMSYYAVLAAKGFIPIETLATFGAYDSPLGHHPDRMLIPGVEISSGSLGHGLPIGVGLALGLRSRARKSRVIVLVGDAELDEGSNHEAIALAVEPELVIAPNRRGITGLRSYFWLRSTPPPVSATASVPGFSVSAEAYPVRYVWNFGEGGERTTTDAGRAWSRKRPGSIAHFYETKGSYEVSVQVIYEARWRAGNGAWNALGYFSNLDSRLYRVREVRAYLTDSDD